MSIMSSKSMRLMSFTVLILGIVSAGIAYNLRPRAPQDIFIISEKTYSVNGSQPVKVGTIERLQKADGSYVTFDKNDATGAIRTGFSEINRGAFGVDERTRTLTFLSEFQKPVFPTEATFRKNPGFIREDNILGYRVLVTRANHDPGNYTELYQAPDLQWMPLKMIHVSEDGMMNVIEAKEVRLGEAARASLAYTPPDYPISHDFFEQKIEDVKKTQPAVAGPRRQEICKEKHQLKLNPQ